MLKRGQIPISRTIDAKISQTIFGLINRKNIVKFIYGYIVVTLKFIVQLSRLSTTKLVKNISEHEALK